MCYARPKISMIVLHTQIHVRVVYLFFVKVPNNKGNTCVVFRKNWTDIRVKQLINISYQTIVLQLNW